MGGAETVERLLLIKIRPDKLGDVLLATPLARSLKAAIPSLEISMWVHPWLEPVLRHNPDLASVEATDFRLGLKESLDHIKRMRGRFDAVMFLKDRAGTHIPLAFMAGVPRRIGSVRKAYGSMLTDNLPMEWDATPVHEAEICYQMAERAFGLELERLPSALYLLEGERDQGRAFVKELGADGGYFCLQPGTGGTSAAWDTDSFVVAGRSIAAESGWHCLITGSVAERDMAEAVREKIGLPAINVAGRLDLRMLAAVLADSKGLVTGSTGTMHVAATQQTPCVVIQLPPNADEWIAKWHPWMSPYQAVTAAGSADSIPREAVVKAALDLFRVT